MENYIIVGIIAVILTLALFPTVKHFKREGGCCGSGSYKPKSKKLSGIKYKIYYIGF